VSIKSNSISVHDFTAHGEKMMGE